MSFLKVRLAFFKKNFDRKKKFEKNFKKKSQIHQKCHLKYVSAPFSMFLAILGSFSLQKLPKIDFAEKFWPLILNIGRILFFFKTQKLSNIKLNRKS